MAFVENPLGTNYCSSLCFGGLKAQHYCVIRWDTQGAPNVYLSFYFHLTVTILWRLLYVVQESDICQCVIFLLRKIHWRIECFRKFLSFTDFMDLCKPRSFGTQGNWQISLCNIYQQRDTGQRQFNRSARKVYVPGKAPCFCTTEVSSLPYYWKQCRKGLPKQACREACWISSNGHDAELFTTVRTQRHSLSLSFLHSQTVLSKSAMAR